VNAPFSSACSTTRPWSSQVSSVAWPRAAEPKKRPRCCGTCSAWCHREGRGVNRWSGGPQFSRSHRNLSKIHSTELGTLAEDYGDL
jgi:hypothetical protein